MFPRFSRFTSVLALFTFLALTFFTIKTAQASRDEMALFFDELVPYGDWVDYKQYGPVWFPTKVEESWRPYVDGRWVPSGKGWVFETAEPWGWAAYHFGNWMPTAEYGWVWVPGNTWYPSTATWRQGEKAIGWAPMLPPEYEPEPAFTPPGGFAPETPAQVQLLPAMYVFAPGAVFILGMGQPYAPEYSYQNSGGLVPPEQLPEMLPMTEPIGNFTSEAANPEAVANWGPPLDQVSEYTGVSSMALMNAVNVTNITMVENCWPSPVILSRNPYFIHGRFFPDPWGRMRPVSWRDGMGRGHWETHGGRRMFVDDWRAVRGHPINRSFPVKLAPGSGPKAPDWPPKGGKIKSPTVTASLDPGKRVMGLPASATAKTGGGQKPGSLTAGGKGTIINREPPPIINSRRAQLDQERAKMAEHRQQMQQAKLGGTPEGTGPGKLGPKPDPGGKAVVPSESTRRPEVKSPPPLRTGAAKPPTTQTTKLPPATPPQAKGPAPAPVTPEQLKQQREAQKQEQIKQLQQKQQATGIAPSGQISSPSGSARPPSGGPGMGSASSPASGGAIRPPKGSSGPSAGGPGSPAPGGFGIRSPKSGGGSAPGPSVAGQQGSGKQAPKVQPQPTTPKGGGAKPAQPAPQKQEKKQEKKPGS